MHNFGVGFFNYLTPSESWMLQNLLTLDLPSTLPPELFNFFKLKVCAESTVEGSLEQTHAMMCTAC